VGRVFVASSPNGRFRAGAKAINKAGGALLRIEVHGKNMFYFFGRLGGRATLVMHVHFGMAGAFAAYQQEEPDVTTNTRLRLEAKAKTRASQPRVVAHLSAMTVEHGTPPELYERLLTKLGPDPLREDADAERFLAACQGAKQKTIGAVLMDQSCLAGVGNIYRSETLYEAGLHPEALASTLTRPEALALWGIIVRQMQAGFKTGSIWGHKSKSFCYGRTRSACGGKVREWTMGGRNVYACSKRQRLEKVRKPMTAAGPTALGTGHLGEMTPAVVAESRKRKSGEGLAVQHVALKDDATAAAARSAALEKRQKRTSMKRPSGRSSLAAAPRKARGQDLVSKRPAMARRLRA